MQRVITLNYWCTIMISTLNIETLNWMFNKQFIAAMRTTQYWFANFRHSTLLTSVITWLLSIFIITSVPEREWKMFHNHYYECTAQNNCHNSEWINVKYFWKYYTTLWIEINFQKKSIYITEYEFYKGFLWVGIYKETLNFEKKKKKERKLAPFTYEFPAFYRFSFQ